MPGTRLGGNLTHWIQLPPHLYTTVAECPGSVLLETSRFDPSNHHSYLFLKPVGVMSANHSSEIPLLFSRLETALASGFHVAGFVSYECGYHFEPFPGARLSSEELPLAWFGIYPSPIVFDHAQGCFTGPGLLSPVAAGPEKIPAALADGAALEITKDEYCAKILEIKERIASGETYQVNFTDRVSFPLRTSAATAFEALSRHQTVAYGALINMADLHILSFSPELFFRIRDGRIWTRPMKGTMPRGLDAYEDAQATLRLQNDEKNRSEHVMIVDLLRNDLGRICKVGSIKVEDLFSVEQYETLLQMTSTVSGTLRPGISYYDIFRSMFPGGSVTGAPKIRTMQIIREIERNPRGIYTGAIGFISPRGSSVFNVAIRTLVIKGGGAQMGVGGGIVADSEPMEEYRECLLKAAFLTRTQRDFQLIETMLWDKEFHFLCLHLKRLESSASYFTFAFDRSAVLSRLHDLSNSFTAGKRYRVRLLLTSSGHITVDSSDFLAAPDTGYVKLSPEHTSSTDVFLRHKTTRREIYDRQHAEARADGFDDVIFRNEKGEVTEGAVSNIFIRQSGRLFTPPLTCGVLPGVFRHHLLETCATAEERTITMPDLKAADAVFLCNSVRGLRAVKSLCLDVLSSARPKASA